AVGALPDGTPVVVSAGGIGDRSSLDGIVRVWRLADGTPVGEPLPVHDSTVAVAVGALPDGTPVIVSGGDGTVRVWRLADGAPVGEPLPVHDGRVAAAVGVLPDGTPDGGGILTVHDGRVAVAVGALPDGTPVIVSAGGGTVRVWRLADGTPVLPPLELPGVRSIVVHGNVIVTTAYADIAVHQPSFPETAHHIDSCCPAPGNNPKRTW
ncbi:MAG TPA: hypothetical protein VGG83_00510, partial [Trebonia sp.]